MVFIPISADVNIVDLDVFIIDIHFVGSCRRAYGNLLGIVESGKVAGGSGGGGCD